MQRPWSCDGLVVFLADLFTGSLARQSLLDAALFTRLQVVGVTLDVFNDVLRLDLAFKAAKGIL